jgi:hypothetical protein
MVDAHAHCTHSIVDRSINVSLWAVASSAKHAVNMMFCGPARDTVLTNRQTEKLNFDTNYNKYVYVHIYLYVVTGSTHLCQKVYNINLLLPFRVSL